MSKLFSALPHDQLNNVLSILDQTLSDYDIQKKPVALAKSDGLPEVVKYFIASKAVENLSAQTLKIYRLRLIDFFSIVRKPFQDVNSNDIRLYLYYYKDTKKASDSYLESIRLILNSFFSWLVNNDYLLRNPCAKVEHIKFQAPERKPLTSYQLEVLRWHCTDIREKALIDFFFSTGVRLSECRDLNRSDITWETRSAVIHHGKGNKRRTVFFNAESELTLRKYLETRTDHEEALFVTSRGSVRRLCLKSIEDIIRKVAARADLHVYPHRLRHTFATAGLRGGMPLEQLQALMGHSKPETTLIYAKLSDSDLQREHERVYS